MPKKRLYRTRRDAGRERRLRYLEKKNEVYRKEKNEGIILIANKTERGKGKTCQVEEATAGE